jgi:hypothetical protein
MTPEEIAESALAAQWVGAGAAAGSVVVAVIFGIVTLRTSNRAKDAQQRAAGTAAGAPSSTSLASLVADVDPVVWVVRRARGEEWVLVNEGTESAYNVSIDGLTDLDKKRLTKVAPIPEVVEPGLTLSFTLVSRLTLSGPANVVVTYFDGPGGVLRTQVLLVPAE